MVEDSGRRRDPPDVPDIAQLLIAYRDRTGESYETMAKRIGDAISDGRLHQLATKPLKNFPEPRTVIALADLLGLSVSRVVLSLAVSLGIPVREYASALVNSLPPGTDNLTDRDQAAIVAVVRQLVAARRAAQDRDEPTGPDLSAAQGLRLEEDSAETLKPVNGPSET